MIRFISRLLGREGARATGGARRFAPRLEVLDGRTMPSGLAVGVPEFVGTPGVRVDNYGGAYGGVLGDVRVLDQVSLNHGAHGGHVDNFGGLAGGVVASN